MVSSSVADERRGQTTTDFVVGISVFLLTVAFVVTFVPQMVAPYDDQEHAVVSERVTSALADDLLAEPGTPATLNTTCTVAVLTETASAPASCPDPTPELHELVGVEYYYAINVTLERDVTGGPEREILCEVGESVGACGTEALARGPPVPTEERSVATRQRTVIIDGRDALLRVSVW